MTVQQEGPRNKAVGTSQEFTTAPSKGNTATLRESKNSFIGQEAPAFPFNRGQTYQNNHQQREARQGAHSFYLSNTFADTFSIDIKY